MSPSPDTPLKQHGCVCLALCALPILVYAQTVAFGFAAIDDPAWVTENPYVATGFSQRNVAWAFSARPMHTHSNWVPLTFLSLMLDAQFFGSRAGGFHLTNLLLHCANTLLLYSVLFSMARAPGKSALVAALFAIHPLHVESVAWVTERKDVLSLFFGLLAIWSYVAYAKSRSRRLYVGSILLFLASLMAKQALVTLPFLLLLLDYWPLGRSAHSDSAARPRLLKLLLVEKLPYLALSLIFCWLTLVAQRHAMPFGDDRTLVMRFAHVASAYAEYLAKTFWPANLSVVYPLDSRSAPGIRDAAAVLGLLAVSAAAVMYRKRAPWLFVGWFWFLGTLVPMIGIVQVGNQRIADRYTYVPMTGLFLIVAWGLDALVRRPQLRRYLLPGMAGLAIAIFSVVSWRQTALWRDSVALYEHGLAIDPGNAQLHQALAVVLFEQSRVDESFAHFREGARSDPENYVLYTQWARCLQESGQLEPALETLAQAIRIHPEFAPAYFVQGTMYEQLGQPDQAARSYARAVNLNPHDWRAHYNLGNLLLHAGQFAAAAHHFQDAVDTNPDYAAAHNNLGVAHLALGNPQQAITHLKAALRIDPTLEQAQQALQEAQGEE